MYMYCLVMPVSVSNNLLVDLVFCLMVVCELSGMFLLSAGGVTRL